MIISSECPSCFIRSKLTYLMTIKISQFYKNLTIRFEIIILFSVILRIYTILPCVDDSLCALRTVLLLMNINLTPYFIHAMKWKQTYSSISMVLELECMHSDIANVFRRSCNRNTIDIFYNNKNNNNHYLHILCTNSNTQSRWITA